MTYRPVVAVAVVLALALGAVLFLLPRRAAPPTPENSRLQVIAAENFWGSLAAQIGGAHAHVTSIISAPNADPHAYESDARTARAFAHADYVILNGAGFDSWAGKLLAAGPNPKRKVLIVSDLLGKKSGGNPHFWYSPDAVNRAAAQMAHDLAARDPAHAAYYAGRYRALQTALAPYQNRIAAIRQKFAGTKIAATEDIFAYLADAAGLDLISPPGFMQAAAEGSEPPARSVAMFQDQLRRREPAVLVYNRQAITPLSERMKTLAEKENIPVVAITETVQPPDARFQDWMDGELIALQGALEARAGKP